MLEKGLQAQMDPLQLKGILDQQARCKIAIARAKDVVTTSKEIIRIETEMLKLHENILLDMDTILNMPYRGYSAKDMERALDALKAHYGLKRS